MSCKNVFCISNAQTGAQSTLLLLVDKILIDLHEHKIMKVEVNRLILS